MKGPHIITQSSDKHRIIGSTPISRDAIKKAKGHTEYAMDMKLPRMLHGQILRSPHAHAKILSIDTSKAEALPGILAVATWKDIWDEEEMSSPENVEPELKQFRDRYLASDKALYCGHPIAAVAATDQWLAREAIKLIKVEYDVLPPVMDALLANEQTSPVVHEDNITKALGRQGETSRNVAFQVEQLKGDPEKGFSEADVLVEREFRVATIHQGYLEPHVALAEWTSNQSFDIWSSTQGAFIVRRDVAKLLRLPVAQVKVIPKDPGGAFGGKNVNFLEPVAALLSRKAGRPVRLAMSRKEVFEATSPSSACFIRVKMGATREGRITAATSYMLFEMGAFFNPPFSFASIGSVCMFAPYDIPHGRIDAFDIYVNKPESGSYRAPSAPHVAFAYESVIDEISEKINMDPMEFRIKNVAKEGTRMINGLMFPRIGFLETMRAAMESSYYKSRIEGAFRGRGVACGWWVNVGMPSSCSMGVNPDGSVNLTMGSVDLGSNARTSVAMQAAEVLSIPLEEIHITVGDTDSIGYTDTTGGSRTTFATGLAAMDAAHQLISRMSERAGILLEVDSSTILYEDGVFKSSAGSAKQLTFREVASEQIPTGGFIYVTANIDPKGAGSAIAVNIVDLEVDPETGKVSILNYSTFQDVGKAIHPAHIEGQIQGAVAQGIGRALTESYQFDEQGRMMNTSFLDYRMPTMVDVPSIETTLLEIPNPGHPYGVRGVGEPPVTPPTAAIANAIYNAVGVRMSELPMIPEKIIKEMGKIR